MAEESSLFSKLPPEVVGQVLTQLPVRDRLQVRLVCKRWDGLATMGLRFLVHISDQTILSTMKCNQRVETAYARDLKLPLPLSHRRKVVQNLKFLQRMFFGPNISASNMKKLLEQVQGTDTLGFSYQQPPSFHGLNFRFLTCLQFQKIRSGRAQAVAFKKLLCTASFPLLRRFNLVQVDVSDFRVYLAIHLFVVNHAATLRNLILNLAPSTVNNAPVDLRFRNLYESCEVYQDVSRRMADIRLDTLWINACNFESESPWNLGCKLVLAQENLECLLLDGIWFSQAIQVKGTLDIASVLERNSASLRRLKLPLTELDGRLLETCLRLEEVGVYIPFEQLKVFGLAGVEGRVRNLLSFPPHLKMVDMHIPMDMAGVKTLLRSLPLEDVVFEGTRAELWPVGSFLDMWETGTLTSFRCYARMLHSETMELYSLVQTSTGVEGTVEYNVMSKYTLVDVSLERKSYQRRLLP